MSFSICPENSGISSFLKKWVLKIANAKEDNVRYFWIVNLNNSNIILLNLINIWYKLITSSSQYLITSFLKHQLLLKLDLYSLYSFLLILLKYLKSGTGPI
uniref:hypothetical protein n=1 Tax=Russula emetica TaxID=152958 RepID=UPI0031F3B817